MAAQKIEDAQVVAEDTVEAVTEDVIEAAEDTVEAAQDSVEETVVQASETLDETLADTADVTDEKAGEIVEESSTYESNSAEPPVAATPATAKSGSIFPMLFGGLIAGGIGYGIAYFQSMSGGVDLATQVVEQQQQITSQADLIATLQADLASLASADSVNALGDTITANTEQIAALGNRIDESLTGLEGRVAVIERQPSADGTLQDTALAAFESDMTALRDQIQAQQEEMTRLLSSTREEAQSIEATAIANARAATARASLAIIQGSLESGSPFGNALTDLQQSLDAPVPAAIEAVAAEGVPTLAEVQGAYPEAARIALTVARSEGASGEEATGMGAFLRNQFDVRSVEPQEGDSVDAILSRTEAALKAGRLNDALSEVASLPEVARGAMSDWTALAEQRAAAIDAAVTLASQLNVN